MPAGELWDLSLEFADVVGGPGGELWERWQHTVGWEQRFSVCDDVLTSLVGENLVAPELQHCWGRLETILPSGSERLVATPCTWCVTTSTKSSRVPRTRGRRSCVSWSMKVTDREVSRCATRRAICGASAPTEEVGMAERSEKSSRLY